MGTDNKRPIISMIAAVDDEWNLAIDGKLPWQSQLADKRYYLEKIAGHTIIMGSTTFGAADHSRKGNHIVVISKRSYKEFGLPEVDVINSIGAIPTVKLLSGEEEVFITGGSSIYMAVEDEIVDRIYLNIIHTGKSRTGKNVKFPRLDIKNKWNLVSSNNILADKDNEFSADFMIYERVPGS
jgi:dihydrofolate reductase